MLPVRMANTASKPGKRCKAYVYNCAECSREEIVRLTDGLTHNLTADFTMQEFNGWKKIRGKGWTCPVCIGRESDQKK